MLLLPIILFIQQLLFSVRPMANDPSSLPKKLVPESCTRSLCPSSAHQTHKKVEETGTRNTAGDTSYDDDAVAAVIIMLITTENRQILYHAQV